MLLGEYISPLGEKNRIALPKRLRGSLAGELIITRGYERSLIIVDKPRWHILLEEINKHSLLNLSVRDTKRFLLGGGFEVIPDRQGRFVIPEALIGYAHIENSITFVGVGEWLEIWSTERWQEKLAYLAENSADIADRLDNQRK